MFIPYKPLFCILTLTVFLLSERSLQAETVEYDGLIQPYEVVAIGAPTPGIVAKVTVDRSSRIQQGQVLVELESSVERAALEEASTRAGFTGEIDLQLHQLAFAKRAHQRIKQLAAISLHEKDLAATEAAMAEHRLEKSKENKILAAIDQKKAQAVLNHYSVKSPISGVVMDRYVSPGEYVSTQPLLRVAQIHPLRVEVIVPAQIFGKMQPGMTATIVPELPIYGEQTATVTIVDKVIDSASSTFGVRLELPNADQQIPSGLKCLVRFAIETGAADLKQATSSVVPDQR